MPKRLRAEPPPAVLIGLLTTAMAVAAYLLGALSVLSVFILKDLEITRAQLGVAFAVFPLVGALASPIVGAVADRRARDVMQGLFLASAVALSAAACAPNYGFLLGAAALGGLALSSANPVTNRLILEEIPPVHCGRAVGFKQAGPSFGVLVAGLVLPPLASAIGWRGALASGVILPAAGLLGARVLVRSDREQRACPVVETVNTGLRPTVNWLTALGFGVALASSIVLAFLPLYAHEEVGLSPSMAGGVASLFGLAGAAGRIAWGTWSGRFRRPSTALLAISLLSILAVLSLAAAAPLGHALLWLGAAAAGGSIYAWHVVAYLIIIDRVGPRGIGRASGVVQSGMATGFAAGPPLAGAVVDATESYALMWWLVAGMLAAITVLTWVARPGSVRRSPVKRGM